MSAKQNPTVRFLVEQQKLAAQGQQRKQQSSGVSGESNLSRETRISRFNDMVNRCPEYLNVRKTKNFVRKQPSQRTRRPLESLRQIGISELEVGKTHGGCVLYCRVATKVMTMNSAMCLVEDHDKEDLVDLAVYNLKDTSDLREGRTLAVIEPFFKTRADGRNGIRVDEPETDLVFDIEPTEIPETPKQEYPPAPEKSLSVEARLQEIVESNPEIGVNKLYKQILEEGYNINKKRVRALKLKAAAVNQPSQNGTETDLVPVLSERRPEKHQVFHSGAIASLKEKGNSAFVQGDFETAERLYTEALDESKKPVSEDASEGGQDGVSLWQLYGNRCVLRE